ncbi:MAG: hypothetical protein K2X81_01270 [Candidatus Obscuribacterales bacterium]|nr:hypothetical protein [Candidatus Obscuribacterales bacterium]
MTNVYFFATREDLPSILDFVIEQGCQVFDTQSEINEEVKQFNSVDDALSSKHLQTHNSANFRVWYPPGKGKVLFNKIELSSPKYKLGDYYYVTEGWGLFDINISGCWEQRKNLGPSTFGVNSEKRALEWQETYVDRLGLASDWDWAQNRKLMNAVRYHINKRLSVEKYASRAVLPGAIKVRNAGYTLVG